MVQCVFSITLFCLLFVGIGNSLHVSHELRIFGRYTKCVTNCHIFLVSSTDLYTSLSPEVSESYSKCRYGINNGCLFTRPPSPTDRLGIKANHQATPNTDQMRYNMLFEATWHVHK